MVEISEGILFDIPFPLETINLNFTLECLDFLSTWKFFREVKLFRKYVSVPFAKIGGVFTRMRRLCAKSARRYLALDDASPLVARFARLNICFSRVDSFAFFSQLFSPAPLEISCNPLSILRIHLFPHSDVSFRKE